MNLQRFSVLFDETICVSIAGDTELAFNFSTPHQGHIRYLGTTAAEASDGLGSLYVLHISNEETVVPAITWYARIAYTDD